MSATCKSEGCGAEIVWAESVASGKPMPLDALPNPADGNVRILEDGKAQVLGPNAAEEARAAGEELRTSHHFTCPDADRWRR